MSKAPALPPSAPAAPSRSLRVLILTASYAPVLGGLQTAVHALARHLHQQGQAVRVVTNRYPRTLPDSEIIDGVPVQRWPFLRPELRHLRRGRPDLYLASLYYYPTVRRWLGRLMQEFRPDVVNLHFPDAQVPFVLALRRRFDFRLVVSLHGHDIMRFTMQDEGHDARDVSGLRALLRAADAVTACSQHLLEEAARLESTVMAKGTAIGNGIDPRRFCDTSAYGHPKPYILALGRLTHKKGFDMLLEAFARVGPAYPSVDLILAGEGEERTLLEATAIRLGLARRAHFYGRASQAEVVKLLRGCLFLAIPSRAEPFGIVALEALAAGRPVLATRVGGMAEFLEQLLASARVAPTSGDSPILLTSPSSAGLAEGLRTCLRAEWSAPDRQILTTTVLNAYSWSKVSQRYEEALAGRN